ncbi:MAG: hypothetical protein ACI8RD_007483 [Bacillariaceae sp.]|jgi:hypothetical protein
MKKKENQDKRERLSQFRNNAYHMNNKEIKLKVKHMYIHSIEIATCIY